MAIQSSINNMIGTIGTAVTLGGHLAEQKKANELNLIKTADELMEESSNIGKEAESLVQKTEGNLNASQENATRIAELESENPLKNPSQSLMRDKSGKFMTREKSADMLRIANEKISQDQAAVQAQKHMLTARMEMYNKKLDVVSAIRKGVAPNLQENLTPRQLDSVNSVKKEVELLRGGNK